MNDQPLPQAPVTRRTRLIVTAAIAGLVILILLAVAVAITTTAVGNRATAPASSAPPSAPPTAVAYSTPAEIQRALEANHITCANFTVVTGRPILATADARCHNEDGTGVVLRIYANHTDAESQSALLSRSIEGTKVELNLLIGENWTISCANEPWLSRVSTHLGGHLVHVSG